MILRNSALKYRDLKTTSVENAPIRQKEKVVFVLQSLTAGGAERVLITLMNGLDRSRFAPEFIVMNEKGTLRDWIAQDIPVHSLGNLKISRGLHKLVHKLNDIAPDTIVSTMAAMNFGVLLAKPFLKKKARIVIREAVIPSSIAENQKRPWIVKMAYKRLYPQADLIISPARCIIEEFRNYLGMEIKDHRLLHNPVDMNRIRSGQVIQPKTTVDRLKTPHFVCAGRLHVQKGFDRLIEAMATIKDKPWSLTILGEGCERAALEKLIEHHEMQDRITLAGLVERPWPVIAAADAFLMPSRWEGLPNAVLEALAVGTPVIATQESGGIQEIARMCDKGAVQVAQSMDDMVNIIQAVRPNPARAFRASLLPEYFYLENVIESFSHLLSPVYSRKIVTGHTADRLLSSGADKKNADQMHISQKRRFGRRKTAA